MSAARAVASPGAALRDHRAPAWLPGGHLQTIWPSLFARPWLREAPPYRRERWTTPDADFVDLDHLDAGDPAAPRLVLFHGLESSSTSRYAIAFALAARAAGWSFTVPHFRGCSGEPNLAPRAYHSGDHEEIGWILQRLRAREGRPLLVAGVSLGGNALLRWAEEQGAAAAGTARALAAVSAPLDLAAAGRAIDRGFNRRVYARRFLATMKPRALAKWDQHPGLFDRERVLRADTLWAFDDAFTAPLHGFAGADDYWRRASAKPLLHAIRLPALVLNARNDPFVPGDSLPHAGEVGPQVTLWQPAEGGHVGFAGGPFPGQVNGFAAAVVGWLRDAGG